MWYESYPWYGVVEVKKKILNQYERYTRALKFYVFISIFLMILNVGLIFITFGEKVIISDKVLGLSLICAAFTLLTSNSILNNIVKKRQREWKCLDFKEQVLQSNNLTISFNNDEKDNTIDRFFNGDEILIDTNELKGKISVKLILEEKNEKDNL